MSDKMTDIDFSDNSTLPDITDDKKKDVDKSTKNDNIKDIDTPVKRGRGRPKKENSCKSAANLPDNIENKKKNDNSAEGLDHAVIAEQGKELNLTGKVPMGILLETDEICNTVTTIEKPDGTRFEFRLCAEECAFDFFGNELKKPMYTTPLIPIEFVKVIKTTAKKVYIFYKD